MLNQKIIEEFNITKGWSSERVNKSDKPLERLTEKIFLNREETTISKIKNGRWAITIYLTENKSIISKHWTMVCQQIR